MSKLHHSPGFLLLFVSITCSFYSIYSRHPAKGGLPERSGCLSRAKATEELMERAMKLEYDLSR